MKLIVTSEVRDRYPDLMIGVVVGRNVTNRHEDQALEELKREVEQDVRSKWTIEDLIQQPLIAAWRDTYRSFGAKPKEYTPTAESLVRRVIKGSSIPKISVLVDAYLVVELKHLLPIGGYDLDAIRGSISLRFSPGGESFVPLGGGQKTTKPGEVVYSDDQRVLTVRWNYLDCDDTKITMDTKSFVLCIEAADPRIDSDTLARATDDLNVILQRFCPGDYRSSVIKASETPDLEV